MVLIGKAYFDPLNIFGKKRFRVKAVDDDDGHKGGDDDDKPEWLKRLEKFLKKYESLTKIVAYFKLITDIVKFMWWLYKYVLLPGYAIGKKFLKPEPRIVIALSDKGEEQKNKSGENHSNKGESQKKKQNEEESKTEEQKKKQNEEESKTEEQKKKQNEEESKTEEQNEEVSRWRIQFFKCVFYIYIQVQLHIHFGK
ncbi:putative OVARIAN TUMOR DOMAIN-containing deubiquitinating enzyme 8 isoform X2 [Daucus carota subsp. sativus]|uniref:putative OVARIAN TUMOR DOMAIN-containing deubiquitinating enzyme 8 isoform X2 n=1 Tax=Daucus carota subsp. sativus TaxID=79200 RepID=UPI0007EF7946|nr:PREDICTED: myosin-M heavy chain-like isoform X2 [Daucus carota subsp. sativus]XP_017244318.1 PREDICTED: myosin-M heavy chain-like isoform X2 [Daucus carota subsp. sativus]